MNMNIDYDLDIGRHDYLVTKCGEKIDQISSQRPTTN